MSAVRESHMPAPEITSIQNRGHCLPICICDTLIDLMCILKLKLHFSLIVPKKFIQHYVIKANVYSQIISFTNIIYLYKSLFSYRHIYFPYISIFFSFRSVLFFYFCTSAFILSATAGRIFHLFLRYLVYSKEFTLSLSIHNSFFSVNSSEHRNICLIKVVRTGDGDCSTLHGTFVVLLLRFKEHGKRGSSKNVRAAKQVGL